MSLQETLPDIVAFCGGKGHGKSTAMKVLVDAGYTPVNFADPLKAACAIIFGLTEEEMEDEVIKETPLTRWPYLSPRAIMQKVGTDLFRDWLPETWTQAYDRRVDEVLAAGGKVATSDTRFGNEVPSIKKARPARKHKSLLIRVTDPRKPLGKDPHPSEIESANLPADIGITNDRTVRDLQLAVAMVVGLD